MQKFRALVSAFGFDQNAMDIARMLSGAWSMDKVSQVLVALKMRDLIYHGPSSFEEGLTPVAQRAFNAVQQVANPPTEGPAEKLVIK